MEKTHDIQVLIERFLEGETSLQEERRLYSYFQNENIAPELQEYKEMFLSFGFSQNRHYVAIYKLYSLRKDKI